jgi:hypothetical protein
MNIMCTDRFFFVLVTVFLFLPSLSLGGAPNPGGGGADAQAFDFTSSARTGVRGSSSCAKTDSTTNRVIFWEGQTEVNHNAYRPVYIDVAGSQNYLNQGVIGGNLRVADYFASDTQKSFVSTNVSRTVVCSSLFGVGAQATSIHRATPATGDPYPPTAGVGVTIIKTTSAQQNGL